MTFGKSKYYWGNVPALDIVQLSRNEGVAYGGNLKLLFAASGDMRNVVETIKCLPPEYDKPISVNINDKDFDIVARNLIITLLAFLAPTEPLAIDCMLHIWYSAMVTSAHLEHIRVHVQPLISEVVNKITSKPAHAILGKTWSFAAGTCRAELTKMHWDLLPSFLEIPRDLSAQKAQEIRDAITLAPERRDYRDRHLCV